jgi:acetolactate synthase-1/2/3 large subunit
MGQVGMHGKSTANDAISEADVLLLLGARVSDRAVLLPDKVKRKTKIIHIDIDPAEIGKNLDTFIPVVGDVKTIMEQILSYDPPAKNNDWIAFLTEKKSSRQTDYAEREDGVNPKAFINELSKALPDRFIYCADVGQNQLWSAGNVDIRPGSRFLTTGGMGTMGYAIGAATGARIASAEADADCGRFAIAVCGDGSFQMSMMELATIVQHGVDVKIVVMMNGKLGLVREIQTDVYGDRQMAVDLAGSPDPVAIAKAYGIDGSTAHDMRGAEDGIRALIAHNGPYLLAVRVNDRESSL